MKTIVVLTGAGISAESGIKTFRDSGGLWEEYRVEDVATYEAWERNPKLVLDFYNQRRKQLYQVQPNAAHYALAQLEEKFNVHVITQNVDDLHERADSKNVLHLHGELKKVRSTVDENLVYDLDGWELHWGDKCEKGSQLRPHIVWFGEAVPNIVPAAEISEKADIYLVIGTSLNVYPAAGLLNYVYPDRPKYIVDPNDVTANHIRNLYHIKEKAGVGVPALVDKLLADG
ncbi:MAG: NAD-dependent deacylase [Lentimicrobiaceae bacterium]|nr:NAD-dependent deacylase [Lentimicrobiaceae bacterium]